MKARGIKLRQIKKPRTVFAKFIDPYNRDKIQIDRDQGMASDTQLNYKLSQKLNKKNNGPKKKTKAKSKK